MSNSIILFLVVKTLGPISDDYIKAQDCVCLSNLYNETAIQQPMCITIIKHRKSLCNILDTPLEHFQSRLALMTPGTRIGITKGQAPAIICLDGIKRM